MNKKSVIYFCLFSIAVSIIAAIGTINKIKSERLLLEEEALVRQRQLDAAIFRVCDHILSECVYMKDGYTYYMCGRCFACSKYIKFGEWVPCVRGGSVRRISFVQNWDGTVSVEFNHNAGKDCAR